MEEPGLDRGQAAAHRFDHPAEQRREAGVPHIVDRLGGHGPAKLLLLHMRQIVGGYLPVIRFRGVALHEGEKLQIVYGLTSPAAAIRKP